MTWRAAALGLILTLSAAPYAVGSVDFDKVAGVLLQQGGILPKNIETAVRFYSAAARKGDTFSRVQVGILYLKGEEVPQDLPLAVHWLKTAAALGDPRGQTLLADMYAMGIGVAPDSREARLYWELAAAQGEAHAQAMLRAINSPRTVISLQQPTPCRHCQSM